MDFLAEARRRAFSFWLRTGRLPRWARPADTEVKFNPWHDPDDGRFTFRGTGRYFGRGSAGGAGGGRSLDAGMSKRRKEPFGGYGGGGRGFTGGGATGSWDAPEAKPRQDSRSRDPATQATSQTASPSARTANSDRRNWRSIEANGYQWHFDQTDLFREVEGTLTFSDAPRRSRTAQSRAGGAERRPGDDGGHYVAPRFNGPTEAFNHFAQNANFNRGRYRVLEDQWARALRAGKQVRIKIAPAYEGSSRRPSYLNVWFWIDGRRQSLRFPNESLETQRARR